METSSHGGALIRQKIALLLDFDNMILGIEGPGFDIEVVVSALRERGVMVLGRAYGDWYRHSRHRRRLMEQGIDLIETPVFGPIIKNSADMHMALDAFEIAHTQAHIDTFCIVSGDSDFLPLIKRLQTRDKHVIVIAGERFTSDLVRRNCNEYLSYENLLAERFGPEDVRTIEGAFQLLERTLRNLSERGIEFRSSTVKQVMVQLNPMFSERTFGCSQFRQFLDRAARAGVVRQERDPHSGEIVVSLIEDSPREREPQPQQVQPAPPQREGRIWRAEGRGNGRVESRERVPEAAAPREEAPTEAAPVEAIEANGDGVAEANGEAAIEAREGRGRRRRGGRGRAQTERQEVVPEVPETADPALEAIFGAPEDGVTPEDAARADEAAPEILESVLEAVGEEPEPEASVEPEFVDYNSQLGRVPLRRGRLKFSARLGRVTTVEAAPSQPEPVAEETPQPSEADIEAAEGEVGALLESAEVEALEAIAPIADAVADDAPQAEQPQVLAEAAPVEAEAPAVAEAEPVAPVEAAPAKKRRSPRRKPKAEAAPEAPAETATPEATPDVAQAEVVEAPVAEVEAPAVAQAEAAPAEAEAKPKRPARRRTRKKAEAAPEADSDEAAGS